MYRAKTEGDGTRKKSAPSAEIADQLPFPNKVKSQVKDGIREEQKERQDDRSSPKQSDAK